MQPLCSSRYLTWSAAAGLHSLYLGNEHWFGEPRKVEPDHCQIIPGILRVTKTRDTVGAFLENARVFVFGKRPIGTTLTSAHCSWPERANACANFRTTIWIQIRIIQAACCSFKSALNEFFSNFENFIIEAE